MAGPLNAEGFREILDVSRETLGQLSRYAELLEKWQRRINLVGRDTLDDLWRRHMLDSAQLWPLIPPDAASITDLGSGAGFPGLVLAILAEPGRADITLIESDARKCAFLNEVIRQTGARAHVVNQRIERVSVPAADVVTARACARLPKLLDYIEPCLKLGGIGFILKGARVDEELTEAGKDWTMSVVRHTSLSDPSGTILELRNIRRVVG